MKQILLSFILALSATFTIKAADNGVIATLDWDRLCTAIDVSESTNYACYEQDGEDLVFYILDQDFCKGERIVFAGYWTAFNAMPDYYRYFEYHNFYGSKICLTKGIFDRNPNSKEWVIQIRGYFDSEENYVRRLVSSSGKILYESLVDQGDFDLLKHGTWIYGVTLRNNKLSVLDFSQGNAGVTNVEVPVSQAYPNPLPAGEALTVEFETPLSDAGRLMIIDMAGRTVYSAHVDAGAADVRVPAGAVRQGEYIYTVTDGHNLIANGKVLAY